MNEEILSGVRWKVLELLAKEGPLTASEIAQLAHTSLPAVSQATALLEAHNYLSAKPIPKGSFGKPRLRYTLRKDHAAVTLCVEGCAKKFSFAPSAMHAATIKAFELPQDDRDWIIQLLWSHRDILTTVDAVAYIRSDKEETHILVLTSNIEKYRKEYSHIILEAAQKKRKIVSWSHTIKEAKEGLEKKENYFNDLFSNPIALYDPKGTIEVLRKGK